MCVCSSLSTCVEIRGWLVDPRGTFKATQGWAQLAKLRARERWSCSRHGAAPQLLAVTFTVSSPAHSVGATKASPHRRTHGCILDSVAGTEAKSFPVVG